MDGDPSTKPWADGEVHFNRGWNSRVRWNLEPSDRVRCARCSAWLFTVCYRLWHPEEPGSVLTCTTCSLALTGVSSAHQEAARYRSSGPVQRSVLRGNFRNPKLWERRQFKLARPSTGEVVMVEGMTVEPIEGVVVSLAPVDHRWIWAGQFVDCERHSKRPLPSFDQAVDDATRELMLWLERD